ncbi:hypothetical protein LEP1GSC060_3373 [Leptospira weilii serovar Ranarum str. ICFT]|uniref:Uncharacterized protein n=1 Tax=Leptospira weilii serovar Ranarum str. ICFT TaxID=1218598 RepID=N1WIW5_9LEPT|nr:hypothetical protein LEP1GSC060_3373 [Leptospira weilii serovar Ranarum str. ICFT]
MACRKDSDRGRAVEFLSGKVPNITIRKSELNRLSRKESLKLMTSCK